MDTVVVTCSADYSGQYSLPVLEQEVEEGVDTVVLTCSADGNPKPDIIWRKQGQQSIFRLDEQLKFRSLPHIFPTN